MSTTIDALKSIRRTFNFYVATFGLLALREFVSYMDKRFLTEGESSPEVLGLVVRIDYVSSVVGLLFGVFLVLIFLQFRVLEATLRAESGSGRETSAELFQSIRYYPWVASPLHASKLCQWLFWGLLGLGCLVVGTLSRAHIRGAEETENADLFVAQGYFLAVVLLGALVLLWRLAIAVRETRLALTQGLGGPSNQRPATDD